MPVLVVGIKLSTLPLAFVVVKGEVAVAEVDDDMGGSTLLEPEAVMAEENNSFIKGEGPLFPSEDAWVELDRLPSVDVTVVDEGEVPVSRENGEVASVVG